jgi:hypothetical protein
MTTETTPQTLLNLPFDIFYQIATSLDDRDLINLSRTCGALRSIAKNEQIAHKTVKVRPVPSPRSSPLPSNMPNPGRIVSSTAKKARRP